MSSAGLADAERLTALVVLVPAADPVVGAFRAAHVPAAVARRLPAHVTVLYPFARAAELDDEVRAEVAALAAATEPFAASLAGVGAFDEDVWLAPEPRERFVALLEAAWRRFPQHPPYGRDDLTPAPHLTIGLAPGGEGTAELAALAERELGPSLPLAFPADALTLLEETTAGTWQTAGRFPFGG